MYTNAVTSMSIRVITPVDDVHSPIIVALLPHLMVSIQLMTVVMGTMKFSTVRPTVSTPSVQRGFTRNRINVNIRNKNDGATCAEH